MVAIRWRWLDVVAWDGPAGTTHVLLCCLDFGLWPSRPPRRATAAGGGGRIARAHYNRDASGGPLVQADLPRAHLR